MTAEPVPAKKRRRKLPPLAVDARGVARLLSLGLRSVRRLDSAGKIPRPLKIGGRTLWHLPELRRWLEAGAPDRSVWDAMKASRN